MFDWNDLRFFSSCSAAAACLPPPAPEHHPRHRGPAYRGHREKPRHRAVRSARPGLRADTSGEALLKHAEAMENVALLAEDEITQSTAPLGKIRLGVAEGLGVMFLASRMGGLFERYPGLEVELVAAALRQHP
jgi:hypothetical protein